MNTTRDHSSFKRRARQARLLQLIGLNIIGVSCLVLAILLYLETKFLPGLQAWRLILLLLGLMAILPLFVYLLRLAAGRKRPPS